MAMFSYISQGDQEIRLGKTTLQCTQNPLLTFYFMWSQYQYGFSQQFNICDLYYNHPHLFQSTATAVALKLVRTTHFPKISHLMLSLIYPIWPLISISEGWNNFDKYISSVWGVVVMRQVTLLEYYNTACL